MVYVNSRSGMIVRETGMRRLTKPNMYTNDVSVEITNEYHPRWLS